MSELKKPNMMRNIFNESSNKEYAIYAFEPEEIQDFFIWSGWEGGHAESFLVDSDRFESLEKAVNSLAFHNGSHQIQIIASIDEMGNITPLMGREAMGPTSKWEDYDGFVANNRWF